MCNNDVKEQKGGFLSMLGASLLGNILTGKGMNRAGEDFIRAGYGSKRPSRRIFNAVSSFN